MKRKLCKLIGICLIVLATTACGSKPKDNESAYYKRVGEYEETGETGLYEPSDKDVEEAIGSKTGNRTEPKPSPTEAPKREYIVVLDPGHGGIWSGAEYDGRVEKDENLKHALLLKQQLEEQCDHIRIYMTRTDDTTMSNDNKEDLELRVKFAKEKNADIFVSLHLNASEKAGTSHGSMVCVSNQPSIHDSSEILANCILSRLQGLGLENRGPYLRNSNDTKDADGKPLDYYAINRHGAKYGVVAIILESCYMDSKTDIPFFATEEAMTEMAKEEAAGILDYLEHMTE